MRPHKFGAYPKCYCNRKAVMGTDRCAKHPHKPRQPCGGRPKGSRNGQVNPRTWAVAQTALDDDAYAQAYEREQAGQ